MHLNPLARSIGYQNHRSPQRKLNFLRFDAQKKRHKVRQENFSLGIPELGNYNPFHLEPYPKNMGLEPMKPNDWMQIDSQFSDYMDLKRHLLATQPDDVFAALPGSEQSSQEILSLLADELPKYYPNHYQREGDQLIQIATQQKWDVKNPSEHPLQVAGQLVQEDLLLMQKREEKYRLVAGSLSFPNRWLIKEKLGKGLTQIHDPVPFYQPRLEKRVDGFMEFLKPNKPVHRVNWSIHDVPALFQPQTVHNPDIVNITSENAGEYLYGRFERTPLRRINEDVLFAIKTYIRPLKSFIQNPLAATKLLATLKVLPQEAIDYKGLSAFFEPLKAYVEKQVKKLTPDK